MWLQLQQKIYTRCVTVHSRFYGEF